MMGLLRSLIVAAGLLALAAHGMFTSSTLVVPAAEHFIQTFHANWSSTTFTIALRCPSDASAAYYVGMIGSLEGFDSSSAWWITNDACVSNATGTFYGGGCKLGLTRPDGSLFRFRLQTAWDLLYEPTSTSVVVDGLRQVGRLRGYLNDSTPADIKLWTTPLTNATNEWQFAYSKSNSTTPDTWINRVMFLATTTTQHCEFRGMAVLESRWGHVRVFEPGGERSVLRVDMTAAGVTLGAPAFTLLSADANDGGGWLLGMASTVGGSATRLISTEAGDKVVWSPADNCNNVQSVRVTLAESPEPLVLNVTTNLFSVSTVSSPLASDGSFVVGKVTV